MPKLSIILPVYNGEKYLKQAINSVLVQSFSDWELIIIDDGSTDQSQQIINWYLNQDKRIRSIKNEKNLGLVASLNEGISLARGELFARLDCDDFWSSPDKLYKQIDFMTKNPACALVGTWAKMTNESGIILKEFCPPVADKGIRSQILWHNCFLHSSIVARKDVLLEAGGYKEQERHVEDYGLWLRMGNIAEFANLPEVMVVYRVMAQGVTKLNNRQQLENNLKLISGFRQNYPNYWMGWLKWKTQSLLP